MSSLERQPPAPERARPVAPRGIFLILLIAFGALAVVGLLPRLWRSAMLSHDVKQTQATIPTVNTVTPTRVSEDALELPGSIQAIRETTIQARASGYLRQILVDIGAKVRQGQVLALIESPETDQQVAQAEAQTAQSRAAAQQAQAQVASTQAKLSQAIAAKGEAVAGVARARHEVDVQRAAKAQAEAQVKQNNTNFIRQRALYGQGYVPRGDAENAMTALHTAQATVRSADAAISSAQADLKAAQEAVNAADGVIRSSQADVRAQQENVRAAQSTVTANEANAQRYRALRNFERVTAPFDGVITARNVDEGALVSTSGSTVTGAAGGTTGGTAQTGLFQIAQTSSMRIQVNVPETFVPAMQAGSRAVVVARALPGREFTGAVNLNAGALDPASRTLLVEVDLPNRDGALVPGMYADVRITPAQGVSTLRIPGSALLIDADGTRVVVVAPDNRIHFVTVQIGRDLGNEVEIARGLSDGQQIVDNPSSLLTENEQVKPQAEPPQERGAGGGRGGRRGGGGRGGAHSGGGAGAPHNGTSNGGSSFGGPGGSTNTPAAPAGPGATGTNPGDVPSGTGGGISGGGAPNHTPSSSPGMGGSNGMGTSGMNGSGRSGGSSTGSGTFTPIAPAPSGGATSGGRAVGGAGMGGSATPGSY